jgi:phytanoyl-CoA hydroxylase
MAESPEVMRVLTSVLGPDVFMYENSLVFKPQGRDNAVPWHQDFISRQDEPAKFVSWTALDDVHEGNGAMWAIPKSHANGYLDWHRVRGETHHDRLKPGQIDESTAVRLEMSAGDVLVFDARLVHSSPECHSDEKRRAFRVSYQGFDSITTPRGSPIVVWGGTPDAVAARFPNAPQPVAAWREFARKVGRRLTRL